MAIVNWSGTYAGAETLLSTEENHITGDVDFDGGVTVQAGQTIYIDGNYYFKFKYSSTIQGSQSSRIIMRPDKALTQWLSYYWTQFSRSDSASTDLVTIKWLELSGCQYFCQGMVYALFEDCYVDRCWNIFNRTSDGHRNVNFNRCTIGRGYWRLRFLDATGTMTFDNCLFKETLIY